jgi:TonB family protein
MFTQPPQIPRSPIASTLTLAFHGCLLLVVVAVSAVPNVPRIIDRRSLVYITTALPPDLTFETPAPPPPPVPKPRVETPVLLEPPKVVEAPVIPRPAPPAPEPERRIVEPPREPVAVPVPVPLPVPLPQPPPRPVVVGAFTDTAAVTKTERKIEIADAAFDAAGAQAVRGRRELAVVDGFNTNLPATDRAGRTVLVADAGFGATATDAPRRTAQAVGAAGFGAETAARPTAQAPRAVGTADFSTTPARGAAAPAPPAPVAPSGFAATPAAAPPVAAAPKPAQADKPVEVLYKPTPAYTDEARARRIEGEVSLEVEFAADGSIRVLRVVRGLGHGLDEMARRAAEQIRFKPATSKGTPVDFRATLTILFRLT